MIFDGGGDGGLYSNMPQVEQDYIARFGADPFARVWSNGDGNPLVHWIFELDWLDENPALPFPTPDPCWGDVRPFLRLRFTSADGQKTEHFAVTTGTPTDSLQPPEPSYRRYYLFPVNLRTINIPDSTIAWKMQLVLLDSTEDESKPIHISQAAIPVVWQSLETAIDSLMWVWDVGKIDDPGIAAEMLKKFPHNLRSLGVLFWDRVYAGDCAGAKEYGRRFVTTKVHTLDPNENPRFRNATVSGKTWRDLLDEGLMEVCGDTLLWK